MDLCLICHDEVVDPDSGTCYACQVDSDMDGLLGIAEYMAAYDD